MIEPETLKPFEGRLVVLDCSSTYIILGTLVQIHPHAVVLHEADVHDLRESGNTRDFYAFQAKEQGIRVNRKCVWVRVSEVASISALDDVVG